MKPLFFIICLFITAPVVAIDQPPLTEQSTTPHVPFVRLIEKFNKGDDTSTKAQLLQRVYTLSAHPNSFIQIDARKLVLLNNNDVRTLPTSEIAAIILIINTHQKLTDKQFLKENKATSFFVKLVKEILTRSTQPNSCDISAITTAGLIHFYGINNYIKKNEEHGINLIESVTKKEATDDNKVDIARAFFYLGDLCEKRKTDPSASIPMEAVANYKSAAQLSHGYALFKMAQYYHSVNQQEEELKNLIASSRYHHPNALYRLAEISPENMLRKKLLARALLEGYPNQTRKVK